IRGEQIAFLSGRERERGDVGVPAGPGEELCQAEIDEVGAERGMCLVRPRWIAKYQPRRTRNACLDRRRSQRLWVRRIAVRRRRLAEGLFRDVLRRKLGG